MAIFQTNEPHADVQPRRSMTADDAAFLTALQTTLNTQSTMENAQPVFWVIKGEVDTPVDVDECDATHLSVDGELHDLSTPDKILEYLSSDDVVELMENHGVEYHVEPDASGGRGALVRAYSTREKFEDVVATPEDVLDLLVDVMHAWPADVRPLKMVKQPKVYQDTLFLTHSACQEHLRRYGYNYDPSAHAFAMTAHRSPELERLLDVVRSVRWDEVTAGTEARPCQN